MKYENHDSQLTKSLTLLNLSAYKTLRFQRFQIMRNYQPCSSTSKMKFLVHLLVSSLLAIILHTALSAAYSTEMPMSSPRPQHQRASEFPYHAALQFEGFAGFRCGAAILNAHYALTAAHCVYPGRRRMKLLTSDLDSVEVDAVMIHDKYDPFSGKNDIALIQVAHSFGNASASMLQLPEANLAFTAANAATSKAVVTGWNLSRDGTLGGDVNRAVIPIYTDDICRAAYGPLYTQDVMMCAGKVQSQSISCGGDAGGPVVLVDAAKKTMKLVGIVPNTLASSQGCGTTGPAVYVRISAYRKWIEQNLMDMSRRRK